MRNWESGNLERIVSWARKGFAAILVAYSAFLPYPTEAQEQQVPKYRCTTYGGNPAKIPVSVSVDGKSYEVVISGLTADEISKIVINKECPDKVLKELREKNESGNPKK